MNIEALASIFTIVDGKFKVLMFRKKTEPYKGYWMLPNAMVEKDKTLEETVEECVSSKVGLTALDYEQCDTFSAINRNPYKRVIGVSFISIIDFRAVELHQTYDDIENVDWFEIDNLPKVGYDHAQVIESAIETLKMKIRHSLTLKKIFPSDFTLPEIQKMYEQVLGHDLDRRNFRKKFVKADLIEETGDKSPGTNGRPAKLYRFKEEIENKLLF